MFTFNGRDATFQSTLPEWMQKQLPRDVCIALSGVPDGATLNAGLAGGIVFLEVTHPLIVEMRRQLFFSASGHMDLHNQRVRLSPDARGKKFLGRSVAAQLTGLDELARHTSLQVEKFTSVSVQRGASQGKHASDDPDIGYWLLPRLGFDTGLPGASAQFAAMFPHLSTRSLTQILEDHDASRWWLSVGHAFSFTMRFDLSKSSRSRAALSAYTGTTD